MYRLAIGATYKDYRRLGNALNAFWKFYNKTPTKLMPNISIYSMNLKYYVIAYDSREGFRF